MSAIIETITLPDNKKMHILRMLKNSGKKYFLKQGYKECPNPVYLKKDNSIVHYNSVMRGWIIE